jgi:CheY-like chemotaxis protein
VHPATVHTHEQRIAPPPGLRILVVDDNRDAADSLALLLRASGHDVMTAYDGPSAVALASREHPAVILLDIGLPGMDGYEVCRRVRQHGMDAKIIAMTGYGHERDRRRSAEAGFDGHTVKPVEVSELLKLIAAEPGVPARPPAPVFLPASIVRRTIN